MSLLLYLSIIAAGFGIFALHHNTKHLPFSLRYSPVFLTAMGIIVCWQHVAMSLPVMINAHTKILEVRPYEIVVEIEGDKVRDCQKLDFSSHLVDSRGKFKQADIIHRGDPSFANTLPLGHFNSKAIIVIAQPLEDYTELYFTSTHTCALGVTVVSTFGRITLPSEFNDKSGLSEASKFPKKQ